MTPSSDAIDLALGLSESSPLRELRALRPEFVSGAEACRAAVLHPEDDLGLSPELRAALARRVTAKALAWTLTEGFPAVTDPALRDLAEVRKVEDPALAALARHADMIGKTPAKAGPDDLAALQAAGFTVPQIIALSELLAYACYLIRVTAGLALLAHEIPAGTPPASGSAEGIPQITLKPLTWTPYLPPVELEDATPRQLEAMKVTPSAKKVSPYVRTLAHDPDSYVARTVLFNAIMYAEGGLNRADRELGALGASLINGCQYCANVHARQHARLTDPSTTSALYARRRDALPPRDAAIMDLAEALTATPPAAEEKHIAALRACGMDDAELQDLIHSIAIFGWANRLMHPLGHST